MRRHLLSQKPERGPKWIDSPRRRDGSRIISLLLQLIKKSKIKQASGFVKRIVQQRSRGFFLNEAASWAPAAMLASVWAQTRQHTHTHRHAFRASQSHIFAVCKRSNHDTCISNKATFMMYSVLASPHSPSFFSGPYINKYLHPRSFLPATYFLAFDLCLHFLKEVLINVF